MRVPTFGTRDELSLRLGWIQRVNVGLRLPLRHLDDRAANDALAAQHSDALVAGFEDGGHSFVSYSGVQSEPDCKLSYYQR